MKEWTLEEARKDYVINNPKCKNCKFSELEISNDFGQSYYYRCLVKEELCVNLKASECKYYTLKED